MLRGIDGVNTHYTRKPPEEKKILLCFFYGMNRWNDVYIFCAQKKKTLRTQVPAYLEHPSFNFMNLLCKA